MKTAIEKLASEISKLGLDLDKTIGLVRLMHEALDDEKDQITNAYDAGNNFKGDWEAEENYYKETYKK